MNDFSNQVKPSNISNFTNQNQNNLPNNLTKARYYYNQFVKKMDKSDFCNSSRRYIAELAYVQRLKELYYEHHQDDILKEMMDREAFILDKLENEFGITFDR